MASPIAREDAAGVPSRLLNEGAVEELRAVVLLGCSMEKAAAGVTDSPNLRTPVDPAVLATWMLPNTLAGLAAVVVETASVLVESASFPVWKVLPKVNSDAVLPGAAISVCVKLKAPLAALAAAWASSSACPTRRPEKLPSVSPGGWAWKKPLPDLEGGASVLTAAACTAGFVAVEVSPTAGLRVLKENEPSVPDPNTGFDPAVVKENLLAWLGSFAVA